MSHNSVNLSFTGLLEIYTSSQTWHGESGQVLLYMDICIKG